MRLSVRLHQSCNILSTMMNDAVKTGARRTGRMRARPAAPADRREGKARPVTERARAGWRTVLLAKTRTRDGTGAGEPEHRQGRAAARRGTALRVSAARRSTGRPRCRSAIARPRALWSASPYGKCPGRLTGAAGARTARPCERTSCQTARAGPQRRRATRTAAATADRGTSPDRPDSAGARHAQGTAAASPLPLKPLQPIILRFAVDRSRNGRV